MRAVVHITACKLNTGSWSMRLAKHVPKQRAVAEALEVARRAHFG